MTSPDNYHSKYTKEQMEEFYPVIDLERLGWGIVVAIFILGF